MLDVVFELYRIECLNDGEVGEGEPYLWTAFFKLDKTVVTQDGFKLVGTPLFKFGTGSHGNIGEEGMTWPDVRAIKPSVGRWVTTLTDLGLVNPAGGAPIDAPGVIAAIAVLMEENGVSDHAAGAAHAALNKFIKQKVTEFVAGLDLFALKVAADQLRAADPSLTEAASLLAALAATVAAFTETLEADAKAVLRGAIVDDQDFFENLAAHFDPDALIDVQVMYATTADLAANDNEFSFDRLLTDAGVEVQGGGGFDPGPARYRIRGRMTGAVKTEPVVENVVPASERIRISCVRKTYSSTWNTLFITQVGGVDQGTPWVLSRGKAIELIQSGERSFFVRAPDGSETPVIVATHENSGRLYLTTPATNFTEDNLSGLPTCPFAVPVED